MKKIEINEQNPSIKIAVYGTLLSGYGNHAYYLKNKSTFIGNHMTEPKYTMYNTGGFPIVSPKGSTPIECEIYEIRQQGVLERVHSLEGFRGIIDDPNNWYNMKKIDTPYGEAYMYVQEKETNLPIVKSGKWRSRG